MPNQIIDPRDKRQKPMKKHAKDKPLKSDFTDPLGIGECFTSLFSSWARKPEALAERLLDLSLTLQKTGNDSLDRFLSEFSRIDHGKTGDEDPLAEYIRLNAESARKYHAVFNRWFRKFIESTPDLDEAERSRAYFWAKQGIAAAAPSNYFWTNPGAVQNYLNSNGESTARGMGAWAADMNRGEPLASLSTPSAFKVGENLAVTKGSVVKRNELMELIQYAPSGETTFEVPIVLIQPWINKYYIFDLSKRNSFVDFLVREGYTVFIVSWKNPGPEMRGVTFADYMTKGALSAVTAAADISGQDHVHVAGYCIGGTAVAALMAWLNRGGEKLPVCDWTLFAALTDFSEPGDLAVFTGESGISFVESLTREKGVLDKQYLALTFRMLKSESLIWRTHVNNYLYGNPPPGSDMLFWNSDGTRLPAEMCSFYLRNFYLENRLVQRDGLTLSGRPIDLMRIRQPLYAVGALQDHISPWKGTFETLNRCTCPSRFVLAADGHITGIVNPPSPGSKKRFWAGDHPGIADPDEWLGARETRRGSWWEDWVLWLRQRSGKRTPPPAMGSETHPPLEAAPGTYVLEP